MLLLVNKRHLAAHKGGNGWSREPVPCEQPSAYDSGVAACHSGTLSILAFGTNSNRLVTIRTLKLCAVATLRPLRKQCVVCFVQPFVLSAC
jgi:hypothetical protein